MYPLDCVHCPDQYEPVSLAFKRLEVAVFTALVNTKLGVAVGSTLGLVFISNQDFLHPVPAIATSASIKIDLNFIVFVFV